MSKVLNLSPDNKYYISNPEQKALLNKSLTPRSISESMNFDLNLMRILFAPEDKPISNDDQLLLFFEMMKASKLNGSSTNTWSHAVANSKTVKNLLAQSGVIDILEIEKIIDRFSEVDFIYYPELRNNENLSVDKSIAGPKRIILKKLLEEWLAKESYLPSDFYLKPDHGTRSDATMRIRRTGPKIQISFLNPDFNPTLLLNASIKGLLDQNPSFKQSENSNATLHYEYTINQEDFNTAFEDLHKVLSSSCMYFDKDKIEDLSDISICSALIQKSLDFVSHDDCVLEGRYFLKPKDDGSYQLGTGPRSNSDEEIPSYMKKGQSGSFVNLGDMLGTWSNMHQVLIDELNLDCSLDEFNAYMEKLLCTEAQILTEKQKDFGIYLADPYWTLDIAWKKDEFMEVPKANGSGTIRVPVPVLIENSIRGFKSQ